MDKRHPEPEQEFSAAEIGALAHLYRGEVYRSTIWRTRLDTTTNWAVVTLGVALSISFASPEASPLPLLLVGILMLLFLALEARRYRYFNVWRARSRWLETILLIQATAYVGKLLIHPVQAQSVREVIERADIGPVPGEVVLLIGALYCGGMVALAVWVSLSDKARVRLRGTTGGQMG